MPPARTVDLWPDHLWPGLNLALDHLKRRYRAELPRLSKALIKRFAVGEAKIAIVT